MKTIYSTKEWKGYGKQNYLWNEYREDGNQIKKIKCRRHKHFNGKENEWLNDEKFEQAWKKSDSSLPGWLHKFI